MDFNVFYTKNKNLVYNLALQYVQNIEQAQEITQDVFLKASQKIHTFKGQSKVETWLYRITINTSLDAIKAKKRKKRFALFSHNQDELNNYTNFNHPGVTLENKEALQALFSLINKLPKTQKTALILVKIEGKSIKEVAHILEKTPKAIESLLQRAKTQLKKHRNQTEGL
jgi:RNA polymerase sigma factor (sigma-70 family)|tara:strand:+ start:1516 stop:2025 length:510 start_codon:yes stop_codon:yes gene_type:complete